MFSQGENNRRYQTDLCILAERERLTRERDEARAAHTNALNQIGDLCMENANLLARVKRLEEAGDELTNCIACGCNDGGCKTCRVSEDKWTKAKEAKS